MAKYYKTYRINPEYSEPEGIISYEFYKSGFWDGFGDCSYYSVNLGTRCLYKKEFSNDYFSEYEDEVSNFVTFVHKKEFDCLSTKEFEFITSDKFHYICDFLRNSRFKFNDNCTSIELQRDFIYFDINDVGRDKSIGNSNYIEKLWNNQTEEYEEYYIGKITLNQYDTSIKIPVVRPNPNSGIVEIIEIRTEQSLFKCLCFCLKMNLLNSLVYPRTIFTGAVWKESFIAYHYNLDYLLKKFNYYKIR